MEQISFQCKVENLQDLYKKRDRKTKKMKEIDEILSYNSKQSKAKQEQKSLDIEFDSTAWNSVDNNDKKEDFFELQAKNLLTDEQSCKKLNKWNLIPASILHLSTLGWSIWDSYPFWSYLMSIIIIFVNAYYLSLELSGTCFQFYKSNQKWRNRSNIIYEYLLISSILSTLTSAFYKIMTATFVFDASLFTFGCKLLIYFGIIRFQLKLIKNIKYIIWIQKQSSKSGFKDEDFGSQNFQIS